eukprot:13544_1
MLVGIVLTLDAQIVFYEFNSNHETDKKWITDQLSKFTVHSVDSSSSVIIEKREISNLSIDIINLNQNDVNIIDSFNHLQDIDHKQLILYRIKQSQLFTISLLYLIENIDNIEISVPNAIAQVFYTQIISYFTDENIENIPLYIIQIRCKTIYQSLMIKQNCLYWCSCVCATQNHSHTNELFQYHALIQMLQINNPPPMLPPYQEQDQKEDIEYNKPPLPASIMHKQRGSAEYKLERALAVQHELERELMTLNQATDPYESAKRLIEYISTQQDPLLDMDNAFHVFHSAMMLFPMPSISVPKFYTTVHEQYTQWNKARQLVDNIFTDLENIFYLLSKLIVKFDPLLDKDMQSIYNHSKFQYVLLFIAMLVINIIIYAFIIVVTLVIILPSCFFLLVVRMQKIEIDTDALADRDAQLITETCCQRLYRLIAQVIRALFVFSFLTLYPVLIVYNIIPRYDGLHVNKDYVAIASISSYLFVILALQCFGTVRAIRSFHERKKMNDQENGHKSKYLFQQKQFVWNLGALIAICLVFYEVFQLIMFTYQAMEEAVINGDDSSGSRWTAESLGIDADALNHFTNFMINICYVSLDFIDDNLLDYYMGFTSLGVGLLLFIFVARFLYELRAYGSIRYVGDNENESKTRARAHQFYFHSFVGAIVYGHGKLKNVSKITSKVVSVLSGAMFIVICQKLVLILSCDGAYSRVDTDQQCWVGKHKIYATSALILLGYYIPICVMISPMFAEDAVDSNEHEQDELEEGNHADDDKETSFWSLTNTVEFVSPYLSALTLSECVMLVTAQFVAKGSLFGLILSQIMIMVFLLIFTSRWAVSNLYLYGLTNNEPGFPFSASMIRSFGYLCGFVACCIQILYAANVIDYTISLLFTWISVVLMSIVMIVMFYKFYNIYNHYQPVYGQNSKYAANVTLNYNKESNVMKLKLI